jgi:hypothetical protein
MTNKLREWYEMQNDFLEIFTAWQDEVSSSDIYNMISDWIFQYKSLIQSQTEITDILKRMGSNESVNSIVEDFIYGDRYKSLRKEFNRGS